jgi:hypothetical protein
MKRVIRSIRSHEYFHGGMWTRDPHLADHFPDSGKVIDACMRFHLREVELVLQLDDDPVDGCDTHLPLFDYGPDVVHKSA